MSCRKAQEFLEANHWQIGDTLDAGKHRRGRGEALALARSVNQVIVGRGKKVIAFDMKKNPPDDETLLAYLLGRTGNLKAPTLRMGKTLLVGYSSEAYKQHLGK